MTATSGRPLRLIPCLAALLAAVAFVVFAVADAGAAVITVGSPLTGPFTSEEIHDELTAVNIGLEEPGAVAASPVNGLVIRWRMLDGRDGPLRLRIVRPQAGGLFTGAGTGAAVFPAGPGLETFPAALPIKADDFVGLDFGKEADIGIKKVTAPFGVVGWDPPLADGQARAPLPSEPGELAFNADILPAPAVASIKPSTGSFKGHTKVTILGSDLSGTSAVSFGGVPAAGFKVESDGQITATSPAAKIGSTADVTVTTIAGTSTATTADHYTAAGCVVPKLDGRKFKSVKKKLRRAGCGIGLVLRKGGISLKAGHVTKQGPKPGKELAPGTKVKITLA